MLCTHYAPQAPNDQVDNIITTSNEKFHARVRGVLSNSFTQESLRQQYPLIGGHADTMIAQLYKVADAAETPTAQDTATVNMTDWLNFFTMDVIG